MDATKLIIVILVLIFVLGLNIGLIRAARRGTFDRDIEMYRRVAHRVQDPFQKEDQDLKELSRLVGQFKNTDSKTRADGPAVEEDRKDEPRD